MSRRHTDIPRGSDARRIAERRTRTVVDRNTAIPPIETLRQSVLDRVKHAFRHESGLRETHLDANTVAFVTDNVKVDGHISTLMEICAGRQMLISDQELIFAFDLREAKKEDKTDKGEGNTYLRSWAVTVRELLAIIAMWEEEGYHPPEVDAWLAMIRFLRLDDVVFLRYIGQAIGPNTPHARYWHDIAQRKDGFLGHFIAGLLEHAAGALRAGTCYVFPSARIPASPSGQKPTTLQDLREQVMIALFGKASLVNRQPGGVRPLYAPLAEDVARIERLNTSVFARLGALRALSPETTSIRSAMRAELCSLWNDYERFGNENPVATGTMAFPYRSATKEMQIKMADPTLIFRGGSLILCAGSHTTLDEYLNARPSLSTRSSAGVLTLQFIAEMEKVESGASIIQALSSYESIFPVMNLFPFTRRSDVGAHLALLRRGFETHRPWIVLSFSRAVSSCLASDFQTQTASISSFCRKARMHKSYIMCDEAERRLLHERRSADLIHVRRGTHSRGFAFHAKLGRGDFFFTWRILHRLSRALAVTEMSRPHTGIPRGSDARRVAERRTRTVFDRNAAIRRSKRFVQVCSTLSSTPLGTRADCENASLREHNHIC